MQTARRRRISWAIAVSLIAHLAVGVVVLLQHPTLPTPPDEAGPPEAIIPILILPRTPPAAAAGKKAPSEPIRLHRRPQPFLPPQVIPAPIAPPAPAPVAAAPAQRTPPSTFHPAPQPEGPKAELRTILRQSPVGCANATAVGLNRAERDLCDERFGKGAKDAEFVGLGLSPEKQKSFDGAAARKEADRKYRDSYGPSGVAQGEPLIVRAPN